MKRKRNETDSKSKLESKKNLERKAKAKDQCEHEWEGIFRR